MAKLQVEKRNGLFDLKPLYEWMRNALDGIYRIEVKKVRKPRSLDQNGWVVRVYLPYPFRRSFGSWLGVRFSRTSA